MKVILHEAMFSSAFGLFCSFFTLSGYSHASVIDNDGQVWDTTLSRGFFDKAEPLSCDPDREVIIIDLPDFDPSAFLAENAGRRYDLLGLAFWPWRRQNPERWYCFEAVGNCLASVGVDIQPKEWVSAKTLLNTLLKRGYTATVTRGRYT